MGPGPTASVVDETEFGSVLGERPRFQPGSPPSYPPAPQPTTFTADPMEQRQNMLRFFDHDDPCYRAIRDACWTEHSLCAIEIILDNIESFFASLSSDEEEVSSWAHKLQQCHVPKNTWRLSLAALNELELEWTDCDRNLLLERHLDEIFVVSFALTSGISYPNVLSRSLANDGSEWKVIHSLTFVAISEDALNVIVDKAGSGRDWAQDLQASPLYDPEVAAGFFARMRLAPARQFLAAALYSTRRIASNQSSLRDSNNTPNP